MPSLLLIATGNRHKTREFEELLRGRAEVRDLSCFPHLRPAEETGHTFEANARLKAVEAAAGSGLPALADDSGLEVDALGGAPGVHSARFAGPQADDAANRRQIITALASSGAAVPHTARFRCVLVLALPDGAVPGTWEGSAEGEIISEERGAHGFGYDPLFVPNGHTRTFAEMRAHEKNALSHRARAAQALLSDWSRIAPLLTTP